jgi:RTX calcium-binding nonapeptide repeat (4 copies)
VKAGESRLVVRAVALTVLAVAIVAAPATARVFSGTKKANRVVGTNKADVMRLGGGNDRARGRGGADRILGGRGSDRLNGGRGKDRLSGGAGNDRLNAVDRRRDAAVRGGPGRNTCRIDQADLPVARGCSTLAVAPGGSGGSGGQGPGGGGGGGGAPGGAGGDELGLTSASGLTCASTLPTCSFELAGTGADAPVGTVTGGGGVQPGAGAGVATSGEEWTAQGLYGCTDDGFLRVTIGSKHVDVPIDCTV